MDSYIQKDGKTLRLGYTTGSCAAAAAKAAAWMLLTGRKMEQIQLQTPKGMELNLEIREIHMEDTRVICAVQKDSGDDPDVTNGTLIFAEVRYSSTPGVTIDGGAGIGRVTKPGLDQPVGAAAINSVPRKMIRDNVFQVMALTDYHGGLSVIVSAPEGETLAKQTFNPRLGIQGGISILGTTGIVEPMSEKALVDTIRVELRQRRETCEYVLLTPGNYGSDFVRDSLGIDPAIAVQCSNFIGDALDICKELGFRGALLIGHVGKLVKIAGGMMNTHSKYGDCRMEILAAHAGSAGLAAGSMEEILNCVACDDALRVIREGGCWDKTLAGLIQRIGFHLHCRGGETLQTGAVVFSKEYGVLGQTPNAEKLLGRIKEESTWCTL
ncbi:MAG: cobalt-precorrin-5B (C(1))-methyltransferase CbiD [Firmicutes bacterium]|nr:cobalt-precorrin-5B (C(1))-methyltransferase CbiD [Bacillota bacterium]